MINQTYTECEQLLMKVKNNKSSEIWKWVWRERERNFPCPKRILFFFQNVPATVLALSGTSVCSQALHFFAPSNDSSVFCNRQVQVGCGGLSWFAFHFSDAHLTGWRHSSKDAFAFAFSFSSDILSKLFTRLTFSVDNCNIFLQWIHSKQVSMTLKTHWVSKKKLKEEYIMYKAKYTYLTTQSENTKTLKRFTFFRVF